MQDVVRSRAACCERDPDADAGGNGPPASKGHRGTNRFQHPLRRGFGDLRAVDVLQEQRELVATKTRKRVTLARDEPEAVGDEDEQLVTDLVAQAVVRQLEPVDVGEQDGVDLARPVYALQCVLQAVEEDAAVRQACQRVVEGVVLEQYPLRDVTEGEYRTRDLLAGADW